MFSDWGTESGKHKVDPTINGELIMKLRDKILYMSFGAMLVVLGMVLDSLVSGDADAQVGLKDATFGVITCKAIIIQGKDERKAYFGLDGSGDSGMLTMFGDDLSQQIVYLGRNQGENNEMLFALDSKSKTDKRKVRMYINENGGGIDCNNKMGENAIRLAVGLDGSGVIEKLLNDEGSNSAIPPAEPIKEVQ